MLNFEIPKMAKFSINRFFSSQKFSPDSLLARRFNTNAFYKQLEGQMTPSALRFCQIKWDGSCDRALHRMGQSVPMPST